MHVKRVWDKGEWFWRCSTCKRYGREGWTHVCADPTFGRFNNWCESPAALRRAEEESRKVPPMIVGLSPGRKLV